MMRRMKTFSRRNDLQLNAVFLRETCHREIFQRNIPDQRLPREACFELGGVKVEKDIVTFNEERDEDVIVEEGPQIERARCCTGTHATVRFTKGTFVSSGSRVKFVLTWAMSKWRKTS